MIALSRSTLIAILLAAVLPACTKMRFVIDAVPAEDDLTETVVIAEPGDAKIAMIDLTGLIADARRGSVLGGGENPVARFTESLERAAADDRVKAVLVRINSPGGTVTASDVVYREVLYFRASTGKPVVVLMGDVAASGGYYVACAADEIIAHPTTVTGSIGVIMQTINFSEGMNRIGIRADAITSGPNKAMGSPFEAMSEDHRVLLQDIVNEFYGGFVEIVKENRPALSPADIDEVTDGRVVTGRQAVELGLVDALGDLRNAWASAKARAGVERAKLVKYHRPLEHVGSPYARTPVGAPGTVNLVQLNVGTAALGEQTGFYYLWDPTVW